MKTLELPIGTEIRINFFADSYQYAEPIIEKITEQFTFGFFTAIATSKLMTARENSPASAGAVETYWCTFEVLNPETGRYSELFENRIKISL